MAGILYIISAPSGSGKSTLVKELRSYVSGLDFSISYTTRPPRGSEEEGREYHYIDRATFERMREANEFLESADVFGELYGTARQSLTDAKKHGNDLLLDIDVNGAAQVRQQMPDSVSIFIMPPTPGDLDKRLRSRSRADGKISEEKIQRRLATARVEIENYDEYDYILVNDVLAQAVEELEAIVASERYHRGQPSGGAGARDTNRLLAIAERCRRSHAMDRVIPVLTAFGVTEPARTR
ncbi:MAG TPA: guanylate kinase [Acidobacteriaceae bacterium]|nr:guanylate kinase [Acidobacteriaceae bacterium]